ncbi:eukaryotic translation initiation factor 3 subunit J [Temnothorax curvispinosus]|uniref:Eukaryotic translation initiation factor 3 subunit J n=1 Tax=Temnothorax curvispinosus TaxID=300111 RepID=A0A6J1QF25_9HYME|nr:eukaryotic translation initiation factor 3 subunit J [Temnothorax curvispinosus]
MDEEWDVDDVDNVEAKFDLAMRSNKWEGEDEEEEVKDSWEDVEEEKKDVEKRDVEKPAEAPKAKPKPKKALAERIEEREKKAKEEAERKVKEIEESLTPEERRAELLRRQRLQEEADLRLAMETFGVTNATEVSPNESLDTMVPDTKEEFEQFGTALLQKINQFNKHAEYPPFAEELIKSIALNLSSNYLKKVKTIVDNLLIEKQKMEKGDKAKKNKGKGKAKLKIEGDNTLLSEYGDYVYDEFDDFM